jgi:hypothetical protein
LRVFPGQHPREARTILTRGGHDALEPGSAFVFTFTAVSGRHPRRPSRHGQLAISASNPPAPSNQVGCAYPVADSTLVLPVSAALAGSPTDPFRSSSLQIFIAARRAPVFVILYRGRQESSLLRHPVSFLFKGRQLVELRQPPCIPVVQIQ